MNNAFDAFEKSVKRAHKDAFDIICVSLLVIGSVYLLARLIPWALVGFPVVR